MFVVLCLEEKHLADLSKPDEGPSDEPVWLPGQTYSLAIFCRRTGETGLQAERMTGGAFDRKIAPED